MFYNENVYYFLYLSTSSIYGENLFSEVQVKIVLASQIPGFSKHSFLQSKLTKQPCFLYLDGNSQKLGLGNLVLGPYNWLNLKNEQMKLTDFLQAGKNPLKRWLKIFWESMVINGCGHSGHGTLKLTLCEEWTDEINWFLHLDTDSQKLRLIKNFLR